MNSELEKTEGKQHGGVETQNPYDAGAVQRFPYTITENGEKAATAHLYKPLDDARYVEFLESIHIEGDDKEETDDLNKAKHALWRDLIQEIENIEVEDGQDFRDLADYENEVKPSIDDYLAVAIVEPEKTAAGKRKFGLRTSQTIVTEAYFNGVKNPVKQFHVLRIKTDEFSKKYERIIRRQYKQEITKGLRRAAKIFYVPQDEAKGVLYDEMLFSQTGFANGTIPLRFKVVVLDYVFASTLDPK